MLKNVWISRQSELVDSTMLDKPITIIGGGAIGSFTALMLAKTGFNNITVYDFDTVEEENIGPQFFRFSDIGKPKVEALKDLIKDFTQIEIKTVNGRYESGTFPGIVISAVDSMKVRKLIWDNHKFIGLNTNIFIDARMAIETALMYAMNPMKKKDVDSYEKTLYSDDDSVQERCTFKATSSTSCLIAGMITKVVRDVVAGNKHIRVMQWSIKDNKQECYINKE